MSTSVLGLKRYIPGSCHGRWMGQGGVTENGHAILRETSCWPSCDWTGKIGGGEYDVLVQSEIQTSVRLGKGRIAFEAGTY